MTEIVVLGTSDIHGFYTATEEQGGLNTLASVFKSEKQPIVIDNGDYLVGSPMTSFYNTMFEVSPLIEVANHLAIDVMVPGNHDFDYGVEFLKKQVKAFSGTYLCANLVDNTDQLIFAPYTIIEREGVKVGIIGVVTSNMSQLTPYHKIQAVKFLDVVSTLKKWVPKMQQEADVIIVSYHGGIERDMETGEPTQYDTGEDQTYRIIQEVAGIDGVICGHQHRTNHGLLKQTAFVQPGYKGHYVGKLSFIIENEQISQRRSQLIDTTKGFEKENLFVNDSLYQQWLNQPLNLTSFSRFLFHTFNCSYQCIVLKGETNGQFINSFQAPYMVCKYHLSYEETYEALKETSISGLSVVDGQIVPKKESYRILTNTNKFPQYRLEETYVNNIWDEYMAFEKENGV